jgi:ribosomal protein S12 methylthiotransferase accessory factor
MAGLLQPQQRWETDTMGDTRELRITLDGKRRITAHVGKHEIHTDQPVSAGGDDSAPTPFDLFLASIGTCAGIFIQGFCAARNLDFTGIQIQQWPRYDAQGVLASVELAIELPPHFPPRYHEPLIRVVEQCKVKRAIAAQPEFQIRISAQISSAALDPVQPHQHH